MKAPPRSSRLPGRSWAPPRTCHRSNTRAGGRRAQRSLLPRMCGRCAAHRSAAIPRWRAVCGYAPAPRTQPPSLRSFRPGFPEQLDGLVLSLLAKNPANRPVSAKHVAALLTTIGSPSTDIASQGATASQPAFMRVPVESARTRSARLPLCMLRAPWLPDWPPSTWRVPGTDPRRRATCLHHPGPRTAGLRPIGYRESLRRGRPCTC